MEELEEIAPYQSKLVQAAHVKREPSDLLDERRAALRRLGAEVPSVEALKKHADKFGTEAVVETAAEVGYGVDALIRLFDHCDLVDSATDRARKYSKGLKRSSSEARAKALLGLKDDDRDGENRTPDA